MSPARRAGRPTGGFTLIEMMIVVAVIAILAAIAYPSYTKQAAKSRRADAKTALLDLAQREERYMSTANTYTTDPVALGYGAGSKFPMAVLSGSTAYYTMTLTADSTTYSLTAAPIGSQSSDSCGSYTLDQLGRQGVNGGTSSAADCW